MRSCLNFEAYIFFSDWLQTIMNDMVNTHRKIAPFDIFCSGDFFSSASMANGFRHINGKFSKDHSCLENLDSHTKGKMNENENFV